VADIEKIEKTEVWFDRAIIKVGELRIESEGFGSYAKVFLDGVEQQNVQAIFIGCNARTDNVMRVRLDIVPGAFKKP